MVPIEPITVGAAEGQNPSQALGSTDQARPSYQTLDESSSPLTTNLDAENRALRKLCASLSSSQEELVGKIAELEQRLPGPKHQARDAPTSPGGLSATSDAVALETNVMEENASLKAQLSKLEARLEAVESQKAIAPQGGCCVVS